MPVVLIPPVTNSSVEATLSRPDIPVTNLIEEHSKDTFAGMF